MNEFIEGSYCIVDGEVASDFESDTCLLNEELATLNDIQVDDRITLVDPNDETITYSLTVSGIYQEQKRRGKTVWNSLPTRSIPSSPTLSCRWTDKRRKWIAARFHYPDLHFNGQQCRWCVQCGIKRKGLSEYLSVQTNLDQVESATSTLPMCRLSLSPFSIITFIIGTTSYWR